MNKENPDEIVKRIREKLPDDEIPESLLPENVMQKIKAGQNINIDVNSYRDKIRNHRMRMLKISGLAASIAVAMLCITFALGTNSGKLLDTGKAGINKENSKWQDSQYTDSTASGIENNEYSGSVYEDAEIAETATESYDEVNDSYMSKDLVSNSEQFKDDNAGNNKYCENIYGNNISGSSDLKYGIFYLYDNDKLISEIYYLKNITISDRFMVRYMGYKVIDNKLTICLVYDNFRKRYTDDGHVENKNVESNNVYDNIINLEYDITDLTKPKLMD